MQKIDRVASYKYQEVDSELFIVNQEGVPPHVSTQIMRNASRTLGTVGEYLVRAKKAKEKLQFRIRWKVSERNDVYPTIMKGASSKSHEPENTPLWIELVEHPDDDPERIENTLKAFFDAKDVSQDQKGFFRNRIKVVESSPETCELLLERKPESDTIYLKPETYVIERERRAIFSLKDKPQNTHQSILRLLENADKARWPQVIPQTVNRWHVLTDNSRPGTDDQRKFVETALGTPDFAFLEGPPGSGKTTAICEYILQVILNGGKVLLCASTHVAVDNVLERLKDKREIVAVRIGDSHNISEELRHLQIDNLKETEKKTIKKFISDKKHPSESQKYLLDSLEHDDESIITNFILDCANLVCGTTIGILQHPLIKANKDNPGAIYDVMILDEASKTTFQEFLVPALYAKKWLLVGDTKQLSPYVDDVDISANLETLMTKAEGNVCLNVFNCLHGNNLLVVEADKRTLQLYKEQAKAMDVEIEVLDDMEEISNKDIGISVMASQLIIGSKRSILKYEHLLPMDISMIVGDIRLPRLRRRTEYWNKLHKRKNVEIIDPEENIWNVQVAWRIIRSYELRNVDGGHQKYMEDIENLLPRWSKDAYSDAKGAIESVRKIALPSILELLQEGFERRPGQVGSVLSDGFKEEDFVQRHVLLRYQHRMHPDISKFPRVNIYGNEGNDTDGCLNDPYYIESERRWEYSRYKTRALWIDIKGRKHKRYNFNVEEVNSIEKELNHFLKWAELHPKGKSSGAWEVAILTFYSAQETELRKRLQRTFNTRNTRNFWTKNKTVHISLCTVDRFQGHEADVVYLSFVMDRRIGFLDSPHRLNVALTRARYQLVLVGNLNNFRKQKRSDLLKLLSHEIPVEIDF
ncbi:MAG: hypothetical protein AWU59_845 [Methanolobus sp. T82-4]|nr:MAG: hypothetical protein AWU59_845 [Methanolobus sp. T82-4]